MKKILPLLLVSLLFLLFPRGVYAVDTSEGLSQRGCIDIKAAYQEANVTSQAITGEEKSLDTVKKAENIATLSNILSLFLGDGIFCVNDGEAALKSNSMKSQGLFGMLENANQTIFAMFPKVNLVNHLAQEFVPGYEGNNSILAEDPGYTIEDPVVEKEEPPNKKGDEVKKQVQKSLEQQLSDDNTDVEIQEQVVRELAPIEKQTGFEYLQNLNVDALWSETRNIAYLFFVIIMIIAGFMIMFRKNLPGQVVVSVGNAIPRIIISLILVTFSFAITGIMLDLGRIGMSVVNNVFVKAEENVGVTNPSGVDISGVTRLSDEALYQLEQKKDEDEEPGTIDSLENAENIVNNNNGIGKTREVAGRTGKWLLGSLLLDAAKLAPIASLPVIGNVGFIEVIVDVIIAGLQYWTLASAARLILFLLIALYASIRLFLTMLTTYFKIIMGVVTAPLQLAVGAIPGNEYMIMKWFKSMAANILVFVVIIAILGFFKFLSFAIDPSKFNFFGNQGVFFPDWFITLKGILVIASYMFAASAPAIVNGFMGVEQSKTMSSVGDSAKKSMSKIPLIGSMFNG